MALALLAISAAIYATVASPAIIVGAAILGGLSIGGETDLMPYLASRYFGTQAVSKIFGWFLFAFFLGAAVGPVAFARLGVRAVARVRCTLRSEGCRWAIICHGSSSVFSQF